METQKLNCLSCKKRITNNPGYVKFMCPECGQYELVRCLACRKVAAKYKCPNCGFIGPN